MALNNWGEIASIADRALDLDPSERMAFIDAECKNDPSLKAGVIQFLDTIDTSENFWDEMLESSRVLVNEITSSESNFDMADFFPPLTQAGPYKVKELIARGGMGNVYLAERSDGQFQRTVAVKILKHELSSRNHMQRFMAERDILSGMEHPNIARLYDGGVTDDNRPYLVMEYVDGVPISSYCSENSCTLNEKLEIFRQVCKAVEYAHRNLIVHRDLKPDNILVTPDGTVKILDFGIAKIIDEELTPEMPVHTKENLHMLSIKYAAPEQVTQEKITTSTDVYTLGLLLYELITGQPPFDLKGKNLEEAEQIICNETPERPSSKISDRGHSRKVKGDLDAIILKALQKEPEHRYLTVENLVNDILRYQNDIPIHARIRTLRYRFIKFIKRRKAPVSFVLSTLMIISVFLVYHLNEVEIQKNAATAGQQQAEFVTNFMVDLFQSASPYANQGDTLSVFDILDIGRENVNNLDESFSAKPDLFLAIAGSYSHLGHYEGAIELYKTAYDIISSRNDGTEELATVAQSMGDVYSEDRMFDQAAKSYSEAIEILDGLEGDFSAKKSSLLARYARSISEIGDTPKAVVLLEKALRESSGMDVNPADLRNIKINLAKVYLHDKQYEKSEALFIDIISEQDENLSEQDQINYRIYNDLAYLLVLMERPDEAIDYYLKSLGIQIAVYGNDHPNTLMVISNLAGAYSDNGDFEAAESTLLQRLPLIRGRYGENHWRLGSAIAGLGRFYLEMEQSMKANEMFEQATTIYSETLSPEHNWTTITSFYLAYSKTINGFHEEGDALFKHSYQLLNKQIDNLNYNEHSLLNKLIDNLKKYSYDVWDEEITLLEGLRE